MVITVTCPSCSSSFPVDPAKIPAGGVNARCTQCSDIFRVEKPAETAPEPVMDLPEVVPVEAPPAPEPMAGPSMSFGAPDEPAAPPERAAEPETVAEPEPSPEPEPTPDFSDPPASEPFAAAPPEPTPTLVPDPPPPSPSPEPETPAVSGFTFGKRDPTDKAKRLARVLVSDMIMYNAERHQSALSGGTLVQDFEDEIDKSWKEYVDQVGEEMANGPGRGFWTDALNDILAKGQQVF